MENGWSQNKKQDCEVVSKARIYKVKDRTWYCNGRRKRRKRFPHELFKLLKVLSLFQIVVSRQCVIGVKYKQALSLKGRTQRARRKIRPNNRFSKTLKWVYSSWAEGFQIKLKAKTVGHEYVITLNDWKYSSLRRHQSLAVYAAVKWNAKEGRVGAAAWRRKNNFYSHYVIIIVISKECMKLGFRRQVIKFVYNLPDFIYVSLVKPVSEGGAIIYLSEKTEFFLNNNNLIRVFLK